MSGSACPDDLRSPQRTRLGLLSLAGPLAVADAGWHFSYFMSLPKMVEKLESISHIERNTPANKRAAFLRCLVCTCKHVNGEQGVRRPVAGASAGPLWVQQRAAMGVAPFVGWYPTPHAVCADVDVSVC